MAGRNANGEGSVYRRQDGRWEGAFYARTTGGQRKRVRIYAGSRAEVQRKLTSLKTRQAQGIPVADKAWRVAAYLDYWLAHAVQLRRRPLTYRRHEAVTRLYLKPGLGRHSLEGLSVLTVQEFLDNLYQAGQSPASIHQIRKVLSAALTYAVRTELLTRNVARLVELPNYRAREAEYWNAAEVHRFLQAAASDPLYPLFVLLILYGLRSGEARGLRWRDVDFARGELRIRQQVQRIDGAMRAVELKTATSSRDEPLLATAVAVLNERREQQATDRLAAGTGWAGTSEGNELVFTTRSGRPIEARNVYRSFRRICEHHGLSRITLHGLRHTNATTQKDLQVHARDIQAVLGHSDVRMTGLYTHVDIASKRQALTKVEQHLFQQPADGNDRPRCRQEQPSDHFAAAGRRPPPGTKKSADLWQVGALFNDLSGGSSQTRTGDTRLFSKTGGSALARVNLVREVARSQTRVHVLGVVAVSLAVSVSEPGSQITAIQMPPTAIHPGQPGLYC
ncbi:site-specific integrase [Pseudonocardia eucalypti]|uniref:Site-specific integrase n=1 Tax=Pseudonocardia eucalypti TaxID=648755 RepID=A0ABP9Q891_9PSEU|nr:integrase [Pseudonocardia eucalypti]